MRWRGNGPNWRQSWPPCLIRNRWRSTRAWPRAYARKVADLAEALNDSEARPEAADLLRGLIAERSAYA